MTDQIVYPLFGSGGVVNPAAPLSTEPYRGVSFYDADVGVFYQKQTKHFDGGWRWFDGASQGVDTFTIYNVKMHPQAHTVISHLEIEDTQAGCEFILSCAKARVLVDHNYFSARDYIQDALRAAALKIRREVLSGRQLR